MGGVGARFHNASPTELRQYLPRFAADTLVSQRFMIQHDRESAMIRQSTMANEPQRSAGVKRSYNMSQGKPCQIP